MEKILLDVIFPTRVIFPFYGFKRWYPDGVLYGQSGFQANAGIRRSKRGCVATRVESISWNEKKKNDAGCGMEWITHSNF